MTFSPIVGYAPLTVPAWEGNLGHEPGADMFVAHIVGVAREIHRVLRDDGVFWLNLGDKSAGSGMGSGKTLESAMSKQHTNRGSFAPRYEDADVMQPKQLYGIPWRVALALQADGWWLRNDIPWIKASAMPESCKDRLTRAHEYVFLLAKSERYYFDMEAIKLPTVTRAGGLRNRDATKLNNTPGREPMRGLRTNDYPKRHRRTTDWSDIDALIEQCEHTLLHLRHVKQNSGVLCADEPQAIYVNPRGYKKAHYATFATNFVEPMVLSSTSAEGVCAKCGAPWERVVKVTNEFDTRPGYNIKTDKVRGEANTRKNRTVRVCETVNWQPTCDCDANKERAVVLDPFCGSGTTGEVCRQHGRRFVGLDLSFAYLKKHALERAEGIAVVKTEDGEEFIQQMEMKL